MCVLERLSIAEGLSPAGVLEREPITPMWVSAPSHLLQCVTSVAFLGRDDIFSSVG
jgi:hypothetical protein